MSWINYVFWKKINKTNQPWDGFLVLSGLVLTFFLFFFSQQGFFFLNISFYWTVSSSETHSLYPLQSPLGCKDIFYGYVKPNLVLFLSLAAWKMTTDDKLYQGRCLSPRSAFIMARSLWAKSGPVFSSSFGRLFQRLECYAHPTLFRILTNPRVDIDFTDFMFGIPEMYTIIHFF